MLIRACALAAIVTLVSSVGCGTDDTGQTGEGPTSEGTTICGTWSGTASMDGMPGRDMSVVLSMAPDTLCYFTALYSRGHYDGQAAVLEISDTTLVLEVLDRDDDVVSISLYRCEDSLTGRWRYTTTATEAGGDIDLAPTAAEHLPPDELYSLDAFVPPDFEVPPVLETDRFRLRMLGVDDAELDYEAVMSSAERLRGLSGGAWPSDDMTLEDNLRDLEMHQNEFLRREAFTYTVVTLGEDSVLGCVYMNPPWSADEVDDAIVMMGVRSSEMETGLDSMLHAEVDAWLASEWSFVGVLYPGRE